MTLTARGQVGLAGSQQGSWLAQELGADVRGVLSRSDIVLERPGFKPSEAMPLGNGRLGAAVWSAQGLSLQLNRVDTLPRRLSPGVVTVPGLARLTSAPDYKGRLNLYDGTFEEEGGGLRARVWVEPGADLAVIDMTGLDPATEQTAVLQLWEPRNPTAEAAGNVGLLAEKWKDDTAPGATGRTFGSLSGIGASGAGVRVQVTGPRQVTLYAKPDEDGHLRLLVAGPGYQGEPGAAALVSQAMRDAWVESQTDPHEQWWHRFWQRAGLVRIESADGWGQYMENLRAIYLFASAAQNGAPYPGSQAGVADMFSSIGDQHNWDPSAFWHWNLRMQIAANLGAGLAELNRPYFNLYLSALPGMEQWTREHMGNRPGICVPETMRFSGQGYEYELWGTKKVIGLNCDAASGPYYNARTISTGSEVGLWVWQQYLTTGDRKFLEQNYPLMAEAARFLLSYETAGADGKLHTSPSNAHETQWDVLDPTTDLAGRKALYPALVAAAGLLQKDPQLAAQASMAAARIPEFPGATGVKRVTVSASAATGAGAGTGTLVPLSRPDAVIANSWQPEATLHNVENIGLEPLWPFGVVSDSSPLFAATLRTWEQRPNQAKADWSSDPIDAARLGLGGEVASTLRQITEAYQHFPNGFAAWNAGAAGEFYVEQSAVVATALQEALAQDYDGTLRLAPAVPPGWTMSGSVAVRGGGQVFVHAVAGKIVFALLRPGSSGSVRLRQPWKGQKAILSVAGSEVATHPVAGTDDITFTAEAGKVYRISAPQTAGREGKVELTGTAATTARTLGSVSIGLGREPK